MERVSPELASRVLAKVGERVITVADYVAVLDRMDRFERMRYQTPDRRKALLEEMINTELMAREAERRGLDKQPETQAYIDQLLADEVRRRLRATLPDPEELGADEVQAYYAAHRDELRLPERRRIAVLPLADKARAEKVLAELQTDDSVERWNQLGMTHSTARAAEGALATSVLGDVGFVALSDALGQLPEPVKRAAFEVDGAGKTLGRWVEHEGTYHLVRVTAITGAHLPSLEEAETLIRTRLIDRRLADKELELQKQLEKDTPLELNEAVISRLKRAAP